MNRPVLRKVVFEGQPLELGRWELDLPEEVTAEELRRLVMKMMEALEQTQSHLQSKHNAVCILARRSQSCPVCLAESGQACDAGLHG